MASLEFFNLWWLTACTSCPYTLVECFWGLFFLLLPHFSANCLASTWSSWALVAPAPSPEPVPLLDQSQFGDCFRLQWTLLQSVINSPSPIPSRLYPQAHSLSHGMLHAELHHQLIQNLIQLAWLRVPFAFRGVSSFSLSPDTTDHYSIYRLLPNCAQHAPHAICQCANHSPTLPSKSGHSQTMF